jgi:hypothetical protein
MRSLMALSASVFLVLLAVSGCGRELVDTTDIESTRCTAGQAQISVGEGFLRRVCGCQEGVGRIDPPSAADCTITANSVVFFSYASATSAHQIISQGVPSFPSSAVSDPISAEIPVRSHAVRFRVTGDYIYKDSFNAALGGTIRVQ